MPPLSRKWLRWAVPIVLAMLVHGPSLQHEFVNFDDNAYITENPHVRSGLTNESFQWSWAIHGPSMWIPLTWLSHQTMVSLFGLDHPMPHHALNVLLHLANVTLVLAFVHRLSANIRLAFWVACLYAVHPIHAESVSWVTERKDVLAGLFFWSTLVVYLRHPGAWWRWNLLAVLALLSKPSTVTLPCVLLLLDLLILQRHRLRIVWEKIPIVAGVIGSSYMTVRCQASAQAISSTALAPWDLRVSNVIEGYATYLRKVLFPFDLTVSVPYRFDVPLSGVILSTLLLLVVTLWTLTRKERFALVGWLFFLGVLVPMIGIVQVGGQWIADRYMYMAGVGLYLAVCSFLPLHRPPLMICIVSVYTYLGLQQTMVWQNSETLFQQAAKYQDAPFLAHNNLGLVYKDRGEPERARFHYLQALTHAPYPEAMNNLAILYLQDGQPGKALHLFNDALARRPNSARSLHNLGRFWLERDALKALPFLRKSTQVYPSFSEAWYNLGYCYLSLGQYVEAEQAFDRVLALTPKRQDARINRDLAVNQQPIHPGVPFFLRAMASTDAIEVFELANDLREMNAPQTAGAYQRALALRPMFPEAMNNLGVWLANAGRLQEAFPYFMQAAHIAPDYSDAQLNLRAAAAELQVPLSN